MAVAPVPAKPPVWSRDYAFGRDDTNPGAALPPPNVTPWLRPSVVAETNTANRDAYVAAVSSQYRPGWIGDRMSMAALGSTPELGNIQGRPVGDWSQQRTSGTRFDAANAMPPPDPSLIGAGGGYLPGPAGAVPAGMVVNPFYNLPGQEPFITQEAYNTLFAEGGVMSEAQRFSKGPNGIQASPSPDAYDATLLTAMRSGATDAGALGYDPGAPWQRENDYYAALKVRNDLGNATSSGYVTKQLPDGTFTVTGLQDRLNPTGPTLGSSELGNQIAYNVGAPPTKALQGGQDPLQYLMSQDINKSQPRFVPGYSGGGAKAMVAPGGVGVPRLAGVDTPLGGQTYEEAVTAARNDPTLAHLYPTQGQASPVPSGTGAAGIAAPNPNAAPAPAPSTPPTPQAAPDVQQSADLANADGYYMGIPLADWRTALADMPPADRDAYLAQNPLLAEKMLRGYAGGGWFGTSDMPVMVGENGPEIASQTSGGNIRITPMSRSRGVANTSPGIPEDQVTHLLAPNAAPVPWYERPWPNTRGGVTDGTGGTGSGPAPMPGNPWDGRAIQVPQNFWALSPLEQQAYFEGKAGSQYNPEYLAGLAAKYRLNGVGGYANRTGY